MRYLLFFILLANNVFSQKNISGKVLDNDQNALAGATIVLSSIDDSTFINYTLTDNEGNFSISYTKSVLLKISMLGFKKFTQNILYDSVKFDTFLMFKLEPESNTLEDVIVKSEKGIRIKKDTIRYNLDNFLTGNEVVIEDVLKKLPGITVESNGTIKYGNQEIEKVMVDGEDFFEKGYKTLTKSMPINPILSVDLLNNYTNNKLYKGIDNSSKVAINLNLKENVKRSWFGDIEIGTSNFKSENYNSNLNLMNFGKKNKYYFLSNINNIGFNSFENVDDFSKNLQTYNLEGVNKDIVQDKYIINTSLNKPLIDNSKSFLNNSKLYSINSIFNPTEKFKINLSLISYFDTEIKNQEIFESFNFSNYQFLNSTSILQNMLKNSYFTKTNITNEFSNRKSLEYSLKGLFNTEASESNFKFNNRENNGLQKNNFGYLDNYLTYTNRINDNNLIQYTARLNSNINNQYFSSLNIPSNPVITNSTNQKSINSLQDLTNSSKYFGLDVYYLRKFKDGNTLELLLTSQNKYDNLESIYNNDTTSFKSINNIKLNGVSNYGIFKYTFNYNKLKISPSIKYLKFSQELNNLNSIKDTNTTSILPNVLITYQINSQNNIVFKQESILNGISIQNVFPSYINTNFRQIRFGIDSLSYFANNTYTLNYQYGSFSDVLFINSYFSYSKTNKYLTDKILQDQNQLINFKMFDNGKYSYTYYLSIDRYFKQIRSNINFNYINYTSVFSNNINGYYLPNININSQKYIFKIRSTFKGLFNYSLSTKYDYINSTTEISTNTNLNNQTNLDLNFNFTNSNLQLNYEKYFVNINSDNNQKFSFFDIKYNYLLKNTKYKISFVINNLTNTTKYFTQVPTQTGYILSEYKLRGRYFLLSMQIRI